MYKTPKNKSSRRITTTTYKISLIAGAFGFLSYFFAMYLELETLAYYHLISGVLYIVGAFIAKN